jgi:hypothetical protein
MARRWERAHQNGWLASVVADPDPAVGLTYSPRQPGVPSAQWAGRNIDVAPAQEGADAMVPEQRMHVSGVGRTRGGTQMGGMGRLFL